MAKNVKISTEQSRHLRLTKVYAELAEAAFQDTLKVIAKECKLSLKRKWSLSPDFSKWLDDGKVPPKES